MNYIFVRYLDIISTKAESIEGTIESCTKRASMTDTELCASLGEQTTERRLLQDFGFFGHFLHVHAGGRNGKQHILTSLYRNGGHMAQSELARQSCVSSARSPRLYRSSSPPGTSRACAQPQMAANSTSSSPLPDPRKRASSSQRSSHSRRKPSPASPKPNVPSCSTCSTASPLPGAPSKRANERRPASHGR